MAITCGGGKRRLGGVDLLLQGLLKGRPDELAAGLPHRLLGVIDQMSGPRLVHAVHDLLGQVINQTVQLLLELLRRDPRQLLHRALHRSGSTAEENHPPAAYPANAKRASQNGHTPTCRDLLPGPHEDGRWANEVRGRACYFGRWADDPGSERAVKHRVRQRDELLSAVSQSEIAGKATGDVRINRLGNGCLSPDSAHVPNVKR